MSSIDQKQEQLKRGENMRKGLNTAFCLVIVAVLVLIVNTAALAESVLPKGQWYSFQSGGEGSYFGNIGIMYRGVVATDTVVSGGTVKKVNKQAILLREKDGVVTEVLVSLNERFWVGTAVCKVTGTTKDGYGVSAVILYDE